LRVKYLVLVISALAIFSGCSETPFIEGPEVQIEGPCSFSTDRVHIVGLTSFEPSPDDESSSALTVYLSLRDSFDSSIKGPAFFWFELYEYVPRSSNPRGKRLYLSQEYDLNNLTINNDYWQDFLRAYKFSLDVAIKCDVSKTYVLQVICVTPAGRRIVENYYLNKKK
jgi:hypothetical protein